MRSIGEVVSFPDWPEFHPNMTPKEIFSEGSFGGFYWRPIYSSVVSMDLRNEHLEFGDWWDEIDDSLLTSEEYDKNRNRYKVKCGTTLEMWEEKGWIVEQDPYGWVQWYCRFYKGRRSEDDPRQIKRWKAFAGPRGRFRNHLINRIIAKNGDYDDESISPVVRQSLQHWGYRLTREDFEEASLEKWKSSLG